jgi:hypothetical protein
VGVGVGVGMVEHLSLSLQDKVLLPVLSISVRDVHLSPAK